MPSLAKPSLRVHTQAVLWIGILSALLTLANSASAFPLAPPSEDGTLKQLARWLKQDPQSRGELAEQPFASQPLTQSEAKQAETLLWRDMTKQWKSQRAEEFQKQTVTAGDQAMPYWYKKYGKPSKTGWPLYISMHGGGGAPKQVNDQQWENQKRLYQPQNGIYLAPRAPTDSWNMWHQGYMNPMLDQLITDLVLFENVDPNRVYIMGYSAGGDGVYQLAPRMADRFAAAAMMAGHPNETSPLGLRNLPFALYCGANDSAYNRNSIAEQWGKTLAELQQGDPNGYVHRVRVIEGKGHWMDLEDREAVPWMAEFQRNLTPQRIVWKQDDVTTPRFYWLAIPDQPVAARQEIVVSREGQTITIEKSSVETPLIIRLRDDMLDLDQPIVIKQGDTTLFTGVAQRTLTTVQTTLQERGDPSGGFSAEITVDIKPIPNP